jgi:type III pantothenate kinase
MCLGNHRHDADATSVPPAGELDAVWPSGVNGPSRMRAVAKRMTDYLLVDISNSYVKLAFASRQRIAKPTRLPTNKLTAAAMRRILRGRKIKTVVVSSVVPKKNKAIIAAAGLARTLFLTPKLDLGVGVDYPAPQSIGADRLANAAAVAQLYGYPAIVVDFGTAVTFDVVSARGEYIGGVIAPGLEAMTNFLYQRTALLPKLTLREPKRAIGKTTRDAMMSGAVFGYRGLVREILLRISAENFSQKKARIVATGGYAGLIAWKLPEIEAVHPNLTLEGLRIIANRNVRPAPQG